MKHWKKSLIAALMIIALMATLFTGCGNQDSDNGDEPQGDAAGEKTIVYALGGAWNRLMPYDLIGMNSIIPNEKIFDRLVGFDNENIIYYRAAESIDVSEDMKTFTIHLNQNSKWHDGEPVTAYDWEWTFKTMAKPEFEGYGSRGFLSGFAGVDATGTGDIEISAVDEYTLEMHLKSPSTPEAFFGSYSYYYYALPKHLLEDIPVEELGECDFWNNPVGSGPCKFVSETPGYEVELEAFDDYYLGRPEFDKLIYRVADSDTFSAGLLAGEYDICWGNVSAEEALDTLDGKDGLHADLMDNKVVLQLTINNEKFPAKVRHAFELAIDKQLIIDSVLKGHGVVTCSALMPSSPYFNSDIKFERNIEEAKKLLKEANFDLSQTYTLAAGAGSKEQIATIIQQNLAEIGVNCEIVTGDGATLMSGLRDGSLDMGLLQTTTGASPTYLILDYDVEGVTYGRVTDPKYYEKHVEVNQAVDTDERIKLAWELQELLWEESPYINLYAEDIYMVCSAKLNNVTIPNNEKCWEWKVS
ncbi:MAG: ABC transporter substrate-binding protein [Firmicutes bacterium]|nr:ABC transporter substrate-binding protein [Bacillota bacterium]